MERNRVLVPLTCVECGETTLPWIRRFLDPAKTELILLHVTEKPQEAAALHREEQAEYERRGRSRSAVTPVGVASTVAGQSRVTSHIEIPDEAVDPARVTESKRQEAAAEYREIVQRLRDEGYRASVKIRFGSRPGPAIVEAAKTEEVDLIAMATHGRSALTRVFTGSVAASVTRRGDAPVLLASAD